MSYTENWLKKSSHQKILEAIREEGSGACESECRGRCRSCPSDDIRQLTEELNARIEELEKELDKWKSGERWLRP